jgi:hypothetical protein
MRAAVANLGGSPPRREDTAGGRCFAGGPAHRPHPHCALGSATGVARTSGTGVGRRRPASRKALSGRKRGA